MTNKWTWTDSIKYSSPAEEAAYREKNAAFQTALQNGEKFYLSFDYGQSHCPYYALAWQREEQEDGRVRWFCCPLPILAQMSSAVAKEAALLESGYDESLVLISVLLKNRTENFGGFVETHTRQDAWEHDSAFVMLDDEDIIEVDLEMSDRKRYHPYPDDDTETSGDETTETTETSEDADDSADEDADDDEIMGPSTLHTILKQKL